jgi:hypothetical protein
MSAWSDLSNAQHIDRVLASLKEHPEIWSAVYDSAWRGSFEEARVATRNAAYNAVWDAAKAATMDDQDLFLARYMASSAILALLAYDDCEQYLSMTSEELHAWALLSENPAAVLLLPAVIAFERIAELESI